MLYEKYTVISAHFTDSGDFEARLRNGDHELMILFELHSLNPLTYTQDREQYEVLKSALIVEADLQCEFAYIDNSSNVYQQLVLAGVLRLPVRSWKPDDSPNRWLRTPGLLVLRGAAYRPFPRQPHIWSKHYTWGGLQEILHPKQPSLGVKSLLKSLGF